MGKADYLVRPLRERDVEAVIAIDALISGSAAQDRAGFWRGLLAIHAAPEEGEPTGEESLARAHHLCQVAQVGAAPGGAVVGFVIGDVQAWQFGLPRHGRIVAVGVHPDHRRCGVATMLAESLLSSFRKMDLPFVHCLVRPDDPLGDFFRSLGFHALGLEILERRLRGQGPDPR